MNDRRRLQCQNWGKRGIRGWRGRRERKSNDKVVNREREELLRWMGEEGWGIMNEAKEGDGEGEMTFTGGRGETMIDYVIGNRPAWENVERLEVGDEVESDHQSVTVWMGEVEEQGRKRDKEEEEWVDWSEEAREEFRRKTEEWKRKGRRIESEVEELLEGIKERILVKRKKKGTERKEG